MFQYCLFFKMPPLLEINIGKVYQKLDLAIPKVIKRAIKCDIIG